MPTSVRWGIVGTGSMAAAFVGALRDLPDASVTAVASRDPARATSFRQRLDIPTSYPTVEELVQARDVDIVYVASPNHLHQPHTLAALRAGRPVLCEKPFALSAAAAEEVRDVAREQHLFCMEAMWTRFLPAMARVRTLVQGGAVGDVQMLTAQIGHPFTADPRGRLWDPASGGGARLDLGPYVVALAIDLLGPVHEVDARGTIGGTGVDERFAVVLEHAGGRLATISASIAGAAANEAVLSGSSGSLRIHAPLFRPERLTIQSVTPIASGAGGDGDSALARVKGTRAVRALVRHAEPFLDPVRRDRRSIVVAHAGSGYQYQAIEAMRCLRNGLTESPVMTLDDSIAVLDVLDRVGATWPTSSPAD